MQIYKAHNKQAVTRRCCLQQINSASSVTGETPGNYVQNPCTDGEEGCCKDAVQQQWMSDHPDLCEFLEPQRWTIEVVVGRQ